MSSLKSVILLGATGRIGAAIAKELLSKKGDFSKLRAVTTKSSLEEKRQKWEDLKKEGFEVVVAEFDDTQSLIAAFEGNNPGALDLTMSYLNSDQHDLH
jgi:uncharacterized protein YbjT (DUF2867 family)